MRKIEFSWVGVGIYLCGDNCAVEDCFFTHCYRGGMFFHGRTNIVRRCNFYRCGNAMHGSGPGVGHIVEDNLIVDCRLRAEDDILPLDIPGLHARRLSAHLLQGQHAEPDCSSTTSCRRTPAAAGTPTVPASRAAASSATPSGTTPAAASTTRPWSTTR